MIRSLARRASGALIACVAPILFAASPRIEYVEYDLPNGLHVILHQNNESPVISTYVLYHVGSKDERPDRTGFAHFFEHLMFEGTANIERGTLDQLITAAGGQSNASTSFDRTDYYIDLPANELEHALWIESERMLHAQIDEVGVETQREVVKEERRYRYDNKAYGSFTEQMAKLVWGGTPYEWSPIGSVQYIDQATIEEFRSFYNEWYMPNNAILSIAGDFEIDRAKELVERYFGDIPSGPEPTRKQFEFALDAEPQRKVIAEPFTPLPATMHVWRAPPMTHADANAIDLAVKILAEGESSRLYQRLVDGEQAAVNASAYTWLQEKAGMVAVYAIGNRGVELASLDRLIEEEVAKIIDEGVTERELLKAKNQIEAELASSLGTMESRARSLAYHHQWFGDTNMINEELDLYLAVTVADIQRVAQTYFKEANANVLQYTVPEK